MMDQIWLIIDSGKKSLELKIAGKKIEYRLIEKKLIID